MSVSNTNAVTRITLEYIIAGVPWESCQDVHYLEDIR